MTTNDLEDILDELVFEEEPYVLTDACMLDILETALHLMEEYMSHHPEVVSEPDFHDVLLEELKDMYYVQMEDHFLDNETLEDDVNEILEVAFDIYISTFHEADVPPKVREEEGVVVEEDEEAVVEEEVVEEEVVEEGVVEEEVVEEEAVEEEVVVEEDEEAVVEEEVVEEEEKVEGEMSSEWKEMIMAKIMALKELPQPVQRTPEWYQFRWNLITASNAWKAFGTQSAMNQLIYEKCQPLKEETEATTVVSVNTNSTLHWGQKYEPLSVLMYEHLYQSKVEDFGCIQHPTYSFLGASPDGIITESSTGRFGRMLEIKNIVNREITGIPKQEYWIQMQLQMEVCDLDDCDFLETKFTEYSDYACYKEDSAKACLNGVEFNSLTTAKDGSYKGIIMHFHTKEGKPHYAYMPLDLWKPEEVSAWEEKTLDYYETKENPYMFVKYIYWKLEKMSCILVKRNKEWFQTNVRQLEKIWKIIEKERVSGYEHRAPIRKNRPAASQKKYSYQSSIPDDVCLLKVIKT